jgi:hypothetical protein
VSAPQLDSEQFLALSDQKAADWRAITQMSTAFLAFAGALFAAGVGQRAAFIVVLTPVPLLFGVFHMIRNARLQLQMITYLATFGPASEGASWERDIQEVRHRFWERSERPKWIKKAEGRWKGHPGILHLLRVLVDPSAWHTWLAIALTIGLIVDFVPLMATGYHDAGLALILGLAVLAVGGLICFRGGLKIESTRKTWIEIWEQYRDEIAEPQPQG